MITVCRAVTVLSLLIPTCSLISQSQEKALEVTVAANGTADYHTVQEAVDHLPVAGGVIRMAPGTYEEKILIKKKNVVLIGLGKTPKDVVLTWGDSAKNSGSTFSSGTVRPWVDYATVLFYDTDIEQKIMSQGWSEWGGRLKTATYREYKSHGPGVNGGSRVVASPPLSREQENVLNPQSLLKGSDSWDPLTEADRLRRMLPQRAAAINP